MSIRKKIIIPAAGKTINLGLTGRSVIIENVPVYETPEDVPVLATNTGSSYPVYPRNVYSDNGERFQDLILTGTAQSAGDELDIYVTDECLETRFNIVLSEQYKSVPGTTFTKPANDAVQTLSALELVDADGNLPTKLYISVSPTAGTQGIKWAINTDPAQGNDTIGTQMKPGAEPIELIDVSWMLAFRFIAEIALETPIVNFTPEY